MSSWEEVNSIVEQNNGVLTVSMDFLKKASGKERLKVHVRSDISKKLESLGLGHIPRELPKNQNDTVRLFKFGTPAGDLIKTVLYPSHDGDRKIIEYLDDDKPSAIEMIEQIREIVLDD